MPHRRQAALTPESLAGSQAGPAGRLAARLPPSSFFLVSAVFHYLGPSLAVLLFLRVPVLGMAWLRIVSAAAVFALWRRPWRLVSRLDRAGQRVLVQLGLVLAAMNTLFYLALARLPRATFALMLALLPMFAVVIGAIVLRQIPTPQDLAGIALVVAGVAVHQIPRADTCPTITATTPLGPTPPLSDKESASCSTRDWARRDCRCPGSAWA